MSLIFAEEDEFCASFDKSGYDIFIPLRNLKDPSKGYISSDGTMIVEVEFLLLSLVEKFSTCVARK